MQNRDTYVETVIWAMKNGGEMNRGKGRIYAQ